MYMMYKLICFSVTSHTISTRIMERKFLLIFCFYLYILPKFCLLFSFHMTLLCNIFFHIKYFVLSYSINVVCTLSCWVGISIYAICHSQDLKHFISINSTPHWPCRWCRSLHIRVVSHVGLRGASTPNGWLEHTPGYLFTEDLVWRIVYYFIADPIRLIPFCKLRST